MLCDAKCQEIRCSRARRSGNPQQVAASSTRDSGSSRDARRMQWPHTCAGEEKEPAVKRIEGKRRTWRCALTGRGRSVVAGGSNNSVASQPGLSGAGLAGRWPKTADEEFAFVHFWHSKKGGNADATSLISPSEMKTYRWPILGLRHEGSRCIIAAILRRSDTEHKW